MDPLRFDRLSCALAAHGPRRGLLGLLATLPALGGLFALLDRDELDAKGRRKRRKKAHKHGKGRRRHGRKKCKAQARTKVCAGKCGSVKNKCKKTVDCGSCDCDPTCEICFTCQEGPTTPGECVVDPEQVGDPCGSNGQVCQPDGSCPCIPITACPADKECGTIPDGCAGVIHCPFLCVNPTPICTDNVCAACTNSGQCASGETCDDGRCKTTCTSTADCGVDAICDTGLCETCDVCANGCAAEEVQAAIDAASSGDTVRICAGTYGLSTGSVVASIGKNLTLIGAGADATNLYGDDTVQVLQIGNVAVTLQDLTIRKGYGDLGGGISNGGTLTLSRVDVTDNSATYGAGIYSNADGTVTLGTGSRVIGNSALNQGGGIAGGMTLRTGSLVTGNTAPNGGGGFYALFGSVTIDPGAVICSNTPLDNQCGGPFSGACPAPSATCP